MTIDEIYEAIQKLLPEERAELLAWWDTREVNGWSNQNAEDR